MTIKDREHIQIFSQNDKVLVFDGENGELGENAEQLLQMVNEHRKLLMTLCNTASDQHHFAKHGESEKDNLQGINTVEKRTNVSKNDGQKDKKQATAKLTIDGDCDHLLILARSAEMILESEVNPSNRNDESNLLDNSGDAATAGQISAVKQINEMPAINYRREESQSNLRTLRLTQIRRLARSRGKFPVQPIIGKYVGWNLQGRRVRLTDIRRLARHKFQMHSQGDEEKQSENSGEKTIRFSQLKQMARFKPDSLMLKGVHHDGIPAYLHCQTCEVRLDNQKAKIIEEIFGVEDILQVELDGEAPEEIISVEGGVQVSRLQT